MFVIALCGVCVYIRPFDLPISDARTLNLNRRVLSRVPD